MSIHNHSSVEPIPPDKAREYLTPELLESVGRRVKEAKVTHEYDVPGVSGRSQDGSTVHIDHAVPMPMKDGDGKEFDPAKTLPWHELSEWELENSGVPYDVAHSLATEYFERPAVEAMGLDWKKYQEAWGGEIAANEKRDVTHEPPPDLDLTPYISSGDTKHLKEITAELGRHGIKIADRQPDQTDTMSAGSPQGAKMRLLPVEHDPFNETPPVPGAMKAKDGNWYVHDPMPSRKGKFLKWMGGQDGKVSAD